METTEVQSVEVSGWDAEGEFFVELAEMDSCQNSVSSVRLRHRVRSGSLVFVRRIQNQGELHHKGHPEAKEAHQIHLPDPAGRWQIRLSPCHPGDLRAKR